MRCNFGCKLSYLKLHLIRINVDIITFCIFSKLHQSYI
nr:MAG TPA: hypothetical protein [Caudoviricetes sp.]